MHPGIQMPLLLLAVTYWAQMFMIFLSIRITQFIYRMPVIDALSSGLEETVHRFEMYLLARLNQKESL